MAEHGAIVTQKAGDDLLYSRYLCVQQSPAAPRRIMPAKIANVSGTNVGRNLGRCTQSKRMNDCARRYGVVPRERLSRDMRSQSILGDSHAGDHRAMIAA
jgi:hypothetical protein